METTRNPSKIKHIFLDFDYSISFVHLNDICDEYVQSVEFQNRFGKKDLVVNQGQIWTPEEQQAIWEHLKNYDIEKLRGNSVKGFKRDGLVPSDQGALIPSGSAEEWRQFFKIAAANDLTVTITSFSRYQFVIERFLRESIGLSSEEMDKIKYNVKMPSNPSSTNKNSYYDENLKLKDDILPEQRKAAYQTAVVVDDSLRNTRAFKKALGVDEIGDHPNAVELGRADHTNPITLMQSLEKNHGIKFSATTNLNSEKQIKEKITWEKYVEQFLLKKLSGMPFEKKEFYALVEALTKQKNETASLDFLKQPKFTSENLNTIINSLNELYTSKTINEEVTNLPQNYNEIVYAVALMAHNISKQKELTTEQTKMNKEEVKHSHAQDQLLAHFNIIAKKIEEKIYKTIANKTTHDEKRQAIVDLNEKVGEIKQKIGKREITSTQQAQLALIEPLEKVLIQAEKKHKDKKKKPSVVPSKLHAFFKDHVTHSKIAQSAENILNEISPSVRVFDSSSKLSFDNNFKAQPNTVYISIKESSFNRGGLSVVAVLTDSEGNIKKNEDGSKYEFANKYFLSEKGWVNSSEKGKDSSFRKVDKSIGYKSDQMLDLLKKVSIDFDKQFNIKRSTTYNPDFEVKMTAASVPSQFKTSSEIKTDSTKVIEQVRSRVV